MQLSAGRHATAPIPAAARPPCPALRMRPWLARGGVTPGADLARQAPVIVLTIARSGSTLLRFILDSHPEPACRPETSLGLLHDGVLAAPDGS